MADTGTPWATIRIAHSAADPARSCVEVVVDGRAIALVPTHSYRLEGAFDGRPPIVSIAVPVDDARVTTHQVDRPEPYV